MNKRAANFIFRGASSQTPRKNTKTQKKNLQSQHNFCSESTSRFYGVSNQTSRSSSQNESVSAHPQPTFLCRSRARAHQIHSPTRTRARATPHGSTGQKLECLQGVQRLDSNQMLEGWEFTSSSG